MIRERNFEDKMKKDEHRRHRELEEEALHQQNAFMRDQNRMNIHNQN